MPSAAELTTCSDPQCSVCAGYASAMEEAARILERRGDQKKADWFRTQIMERHMVKERDA